MTNGERDVVILSAVRTAIGKYGGSLKDHPGTGTRGGHARGRRAGRLGARHVRQRDPLCGTGLQAIVSAAQIVKLADADVVVAGGAENMSRGQTGCLDSGGASA
jgi:acetyl-CoA C-acetyltransferase